MLYVSVDAPVIWCYGFRNSCGTFAEFAENGQHDQEKSHFFVAKRPFFGQNLGSEYGYLRPREASSAAISAPKSHAIAFLTPWGHVGRGRWLWSGQIHLPWPSRALKMGKTFVENLALRCSLRQPRGKFVGRCRRPQRRSKAPQTQQDMQERIRMHS